MDTQPSPTPASDPADGRGVAAGGPADTDTQQIPTAEPATAQGEEARLAGLWRPDAGGRWEQVAVGPPVDGADAAASAVAAAVRTERRRSASLTVIIAFAVAVAATFAVLPLADQVADQLRRAPEPLLADVGELDDSGAERLYKSVAPSVVSLFTSEGASGTGFVYRPGLLMTNWHVVAGSPAAAAQVSLGEQVEVAVVDASGRRRVGTVVAADSRLDLALVEVDGLDDLTPLTLQDPDGLEVGQPVFVLGSPFGIPGTMTSGMITGVSVNTGFAQTPVQTGLLMTDAAANPGNSGGPLVTADGQVVGVVTLRPDESAGRSVQGLTFALPSDVVAWAAGWLERGEQPPYAIIGIGGGTAPGDFDVDGVLVEQVTPDLPAAEAGVLPGDIVTGADGQPVADFDDLVDALREVAIGDRFTLELSRPVDTSRDDADADEETSSFGPGFSPAPAVDGPRETVTVTLTVVERPDDV